MLSSEPKSTVYTTQCEEDDDGNIILSFPDELLDTLDWKEGDELEFEMSANQIVMRRI